MDGMNDWYCLRAQSGRELTTAVWLESHPGLTREWYWPRYTERRGGRERALFPGYMFAQFDWEQHGAILACPGLLSGGQGILRFREAGVLTPAVIQQSEIDAIRDLLARDAVPVHGDEAKVGDIVEAHVGGAWLWGRLAKIDGKLMATIDVQFGNGVLSRTVRVRCNANEIRRAA